MIKIYTLLSKFAPILMILFGKLKVVNKDLLPKEGGYVIACTHTGWIEVIWLAISILPRQIHYMAKKELFSNKFSGWFLKKINAFPVNRESPGASSLKIPAKLLKEGKVIGIFPSGTRKNNNTALKRGAVDIAYTAGVPLIPAVYKGPKSISIKHVFKRENITVIFGEPIKFELSQDASPIEKKAYQQTKLLEIEEAFSSLESQLSELKSKSE